MDPTAQGRILWHLNPIKAFALVWNFSFKASATRRDTQKILIQFPHYAAILPIYFDRDSDSFVLLRTWRGLLSSGLMLSFVTVSAISSLYVQIVGIPDFVLTKVSDIVPLIFMGSLVCTWILHLHTALKRQEIVQLLNGYHQHIQHLKRKDPGSFGNDVIGKQLKQSVVNMFLMPVIASGLYFFRCDFHYLASSLPICTKTPDPLSGRIKLSHQSPFYFTVYMILQIVLSTDLNCAMFPYLAIGLTAIFDGLEIVRRLGNGGSGDVESTKDWLVEYRACQILSKQLNDCLGTYFLPIHMTEIIGLAVLATYSLIRLEIGLELTLGLISFDLVIIYFMSIWKKATNFTDLSTAAIERQKLSNLSKYAQRACRSCKPMGINIGTFFTLTQTLVLAIFATVVNNTITLLVL